MQGLQPSLYITRLFVLLFALLLSNLVRAGETEVYAYDFGVSMGIASYQASVNQHKIARAVVRSAQSSADKIYNKIGGYRFNVTRDLIINNRVEHSRIASVRKTYVNRLAINLRKFYWLGLYIGLAEGQATSKHNRAFGYCIDALNNANNHIASTLGYSNHKSLLNTSLRHARSKMQKNTYNSVVSLRRLLRQNARSDQGGSGNGGNGNNNTSAVLLLRVNTSASRVVNIQSATVNLSNQSNNYSQSVTTSRVHDKEFHAQVPLVKSLLGTTHANVRVQLRYRNQNGTIVNANLSSSFNRNLQTLSGQAIWDFRIVMDGSPYSFRIVSGASARKMKQKRTSRKLGRIRARKILPRCHRIRHRKYRCSRRYRRYCRCVTRRKKVRRYVCGCRRPRRR